MLVSGLYLMNWFKAFGLPQGGYLIHTWSLSMEEQFYVLWPFALLFIIDRKPLRWITAAIVTVVLWRNYLVFSGVDPERTYAGFDTHADALLIGCALALLPISARTSARARRFAVFPLTIMVLMLAEAERRTFFTQTIGLTIAYLIAAWLLVIALQPGFFREMLSLRPLVYTGRISYGWYLWHFPILVAGNLVLGKMHLPQSAVVAVTAALVLTSYLISACSYQFIERPFLRLKLRFEPKRTATYRAGPVDTRTISSSA
ncbi:acyltransferase family protein [Methylobacterium sp. P31]